MSILTITVAQCSVLLFVIGGDTLSVASMVEAAYYMGQSRKLVLVLSDIPQPPQPGSHSSVEGMQVTHHHTHPLPLMSL